MSPLRDHLGRLDRKRATAWAETLESEFPGIGDQPHRVQGLVALKPYRNPDPRPGVAALVDGRAYVMVDGHPKLLPVLDDLAYVLDGRDVRVVTISSYKWRQYYPTHVAGWTTPDTFYAALRGNAPPADGRWWPAERAVMNNQIPIIRRGRFHVTFWALAALAVCGSAMSVPTGSPVHQSIESLLLLTCLGLVVTSVIAFVAWLRRRFS